MPRTRKLAIPLSAAEWAALDQLRGATDRAPYVRSVLFAEPPLTPVSTHTPATPPAPDALTPAAQDARSEAIEELPPPPPRECILLPPVGKPDPHGWHYRWEPRSQFVGTLRMTKGGKTLAVDLIGVELENVAGGQCKLSYADRSLVRAEEGEVE